MLSRTTFLKGRGDYKTLRKTRRMIRLTAHLFLELLELTSRFEWLAGTAAAARGADFKFQRLFVLE